MSTEQVLERPKTGHGNRARSLAQYQFDQSSYQYERPRTHRSNRPQSRLGRESINYGRQKSFYGQPTSGSDNLAKPAEHAKADSSVYASPPSSPIMERPSTSRGRRQVYPSARIEPQNQDDYLNYERSERLGSSHSKNQDWDSSEDDYLPFDGTERPQTSRGRHRGGLVEMASDYDSNSQSQTYVTAGEVNILSIEDDSTTGMKSQAKVNSPNKASVRQTSSSTTVKTNKLSEKYKHQKTPPSNVSITKQTAGKDLSNTTRSHVRPSSSYGKRQATSQHEPKTNFRMSPRLISTPVGTPPSPGYIRPTTAKKHLARSPSTEPDMNLDWIPDSSPVGRPGSSASLSRYNILPAIGTPVPSTVPDLPAPHRQPPPSPDVKPVRSIMKGKSIQSQPENVTKPIVESIDEVPAGMRNAAKNLLIESIDDVKSAKVAAHTSPEDVSELPTHFKPLTRAVSVPPEPGEKDPKLLLAVKLPDGTRIQRNFSPSDQLRCILQFAEMSAQLDFNGCHLVCDVPRAVFKDLSTTVEKSGLASRTVLHIQTPDAE